MRKQRGPKQAQLRPQRKVAAVSFGAPFWGTRLSIVDKGVVGGFYGGGAAGVSLFDFYAVAGEVATTTQPAHVLWEQPFAATTES